MDSLLSYLHYLLSKRSQNRLNELNYSLTFDLNDIVTNKSQLFTNDELSFPALFIIDKERIIEYYTVNNLVCGRSLKESLRIQCIN